MSQPSAPHERMVRASTLVCAGADGLYPNGTHLRQEGRIMADWPDDDGPVTEIELWALRQMREVPHGQITFWKQDDEIVRCVKQVSEKP